MSTPDFKKIFESLGECYLILEANAPVYTIIAVSDAYLLATHTTREKILNKGLFEVFPDNPNDTTATGVSNLSASLERVLAKKHIDFMAIQKYDIPRSRNEDKGFEVRFWIPDNAPVLDENGNVVYIIHHVADATQHEQLIRRYEGHTIAAEDEETASLSQIERLNQIMISRELRMVELKDKLAKCRDGNPV